MSSLKEVLDTLTDIEKSVLTYLFGLEGKKKTYSELARFMEISEGKIREIETIALRKLRYPSRSRLLINTIEDNDEKNN